MDAPSGLRIASAATATSPASASHAGRRDAPSGLRIASAATATSPASASHAGEAGHDQDAPLFFQAALERFKPVLIDQVMLQMGWPTLGPRLNLKDVLVICCALVLGSKLRTEWLWLFKPCWRG